MTQNLPIGAITSPHAVRFRRTPSPPRLRLSAVLTVLGLGAAAAGAFVSTLPGVVSVSESAAAYEIGGSRLTATAPGVYQGDGGAAVVIEHQGSEVRAGASAELDGAKMTGTCTLPDGGRTERCRFAVDGRPVTAVDTWTGSGWHRKYSDGREADIAVSGGQPVPVPFAVGR